MDNSKQRRGLTPEEAAESRKAYGDNQLTQRKRNGFFKQFLSSFGDPIIKILLVALALNVIFLFREANWMETAGIAAAVFLATFVSTLSEYGSESAFSKLMEEAQAISCRVQRAEGIVSLPVSDVVVNDLILLQAGERIPADGILISGGLSVNQSALNGESKEMPKLPSSSTLSEWDLLSQNQLFRGSVVSEGEGILLVMRVGDKTFYGSMAKEMQEETRESPLKIKLAGLARIISRLGYIAAALIAAADLFNAIVIDNQFNPALISAELSDVVVMLGNLMHALTLAITIVVVAVPEGLPMMITVVLSSNMLRMLRDKVMVRKLVGIETSGSLNILFTDKTGTLTKGQLAVTHFITGNGQDFKSAAELKAAPALFELAVLSGVMNTGSAVSKSKALGGNATDRALLEYILPVGTALSNFKRQEYVPFDSSRKFSAAHVKRIAGRSAAPKDFYLVKGAPEKLLNRCTRYYDQRGNVVPLTDTSLLSQRFSAMTKNAVRVLVLAVSETSVTASGEFSDLILIGLAGIRDELRPEAISAIRQVRGAGVQVVMITGDNKETAVAIAKGCGLLHSAADLDSAGRSRGSRDSRSSGRPERAGRSGQDPGHFGQDPGLSGQNLGGSGQSSSRSGQDLGGVVHDQILRRTDQTAASDSELVLTSAEMAALSDESLKAMLPSLRVVARALPSDKSRLVLLAQEMGMVAGMTGDGINDGPALKRADVGFAMGDGTEVAKEAGDIIITDNNFASIAKAILYGRTIFKSIRKFIVFQLTMNMCAVGVSLIGPFLGVDTPITVIQMLWVNIIMDTLAGLAFAGEPPLEEYMHEMPKRREEPVLNKDMIHQIVCMGVFTIIQCVLFLKLGFFKFLYHYEHGSIYFMTAFFALFIFSGIFNSFNARTHRINLFAHLNRNPLFVCIMAAIIAVQFFLIYHGGSLFRTIGLSHQEMLTVLYLSFLVIPADLIRKLYLRMHDHHGAF